MPHAPSNGMGAPRGELSPESNYGRAAPPFAGPSRRVQFTTACRRLAGVRVRA